MKKLILLSSVVALLMACGDDVTRVEEGVPAGTPVVAAGETMPACDSTSAGSMVYVEDSSSVFFCSESGWIAVKGNNGADGENGVDGKNGEAGASCSIAPVENGYQSSFIRL